MELKDYFPDLDSSLLEDVQEVLEKKTEEPIKKKKKEKITINPDIPNIVTAR